MKRSIIFQIISSQQSADKHEKVKILDTIAKFRGGD